MTDFSRAFIRAEEVIDFLKHDLRLNGIYQEIVYQKMINQAAQSRGLVITPQEIQTELDRIFRELNFSGLSSVSAWLKEQMVSWNDLEKHVYDQLLADKLARDLFSQQIDAQFSQNPRDFEQILLYQITVPYESLAQEIFYQIVEEEISFYEAAHLYDIDENRRFYCGYIGKHLRQTFSPELAELLFDAYVGEVVGPLKSSTDNYELFLVDEIFPSELTDEVYDKLLDQMLKSWLNSEVDQYIKTLSMDIPEDHSGS